KGIKDQTGKTDQASAALIKDLKERGLLQDTLVIWGGEFGRTPMVEANSDFGRKLGRDHHPQAFTMWLAGGGIKPGVTIGETDEIASGAEASGARAVLAAYEAGYTLFDHADIYCDGVPEKIFGQVLKGIPGMREQVVIATKCGIRKAGDPQPDSPYRFDFSPEHIVSSCERSLRRLAVETID